MQTEIDQVKRFTKHLYNDTIPNTREFQLKKLNDIVGLIAKIRDRIKDIEETSKAVYGVNKDGRIQSSDSMCKKHKLYNEMIVRVKAYYNNNLSKLKPY
jgi:uncharacterized protein (DUF39 family)